MELGEDVGIDIVVIDVIALSLTSPHVSGLWFSGCGWILMACGV